MPTRCRTCGKNIFCLNVNSLFKQQPENIMLHQIEAITGLFLVEQAEFPSHICGPCKVALREAILFRERIIKTQKLLLSSPSVEDAYHAIDLEDAKTVYANLNDAPTEDITECNYEDNEIQCVDNDQQNESHEEQALKDEADLHMQKNIDMSCRVPQINEVDSPPPKEECEPNKPGKPASKLYTKVSFVSNARNTPRTNWSQLSEEEIVELKRERRKRDCICELCGRHFTCPSNFKVHLLRHTGVKNFSCKQCPLKFYTPHLLRRHELVHLCEKPYPCQYCDQTFADHSGRMQHERSRHTLYKPHKCTECDKAFAVKNKLKRHMLSHSGVRSFHCEVCKVSFMRRPHLVAHYRSKSHEQNIQNSEVLEDRHAIEVEYGV